MKTTSMHNQHHASIPCRPGNGFALVWTMFFVSISMIVLGAALSWTSNSARTTARNNQYYSSQAAAEAATEKALCAIMNDFRHGGHEMVLTNLEVYRGLIPLGTENEAWNGYTFSDPEGNANRLMVANLYTNCCTNLDARFSGFFGYASKYRIIAQATNNDGPELVAASVEQEVQLATIPIFQYAYFYNVLMEISCGQPFDLFGRIHGNQKIYLLPESALTLWGDTTAVGDIILGRAPGDDREPPTGTVDFKAARVAQVTSLVMPLGTNNSPNIIRSLLDPPPSGEDPLSAMGSQRFYNKADMIITAEGTNITATSGRVNKFSTVLTTNDYNKFVTLTNSYYDVREGRAVRPVDIDVDMLRVWGQTNKTLRDVLGNRDINFIYVNDKRKLGADLGAVRVRNGRTLPAGGLTVATPRPLYVLGHYNCPDNAALGTTNTASTKPAALMGDSIHILSEGWKDTNSTQSLTTRAAKDTTINAAIWTGIVETETSKAYSGGIENMPRFLEKWGNDVTLTFNGSMAVMYASRYATNKWGAPNVYEPPKRNWSFDLNFQDPTKLPPGTPCVRTVIRSKWASLTPGSTGTNSTPNP